MGRIDGRQRVVIGHVAPDVDGGASAAKRIVGERVEVVVEAFSDGHELVAAQLSVRHEQSGAWRRLAMTCEGHDRFVASFVPDRLGLYRYTVTAWIDRFGTWRRDTLRKAEAGNDLSVELMEGAGLLREAAETTGDAALAERAEALAAASPASLPDLFDDHLVTHLREVAPRRFVTELGAERLIRVERARARFSAWYELFPRSAAPEPGRHGTLRDVIARLPYVANMGFDIVYLPPIHPIGRTHRKGKNNALAAGAGDVGSPWAIGAREGGHKAVHPELGTLDDFDALVAAAGELGLEIALDIAFQCSPDHPYVHEHPGWFRRRADGTLQYAENPPKKYEDVYPFDFECEEWRALWDELKSVFLFWIGHGVKAFRVDNPHTKPFGFWRWLAGEVQAAHPDVILLAEAFARPSVMYRLARDGFSQSYQYFPWKTTKHELVQFFGETTAPPAREFFRNCSWPNTPDILNAFLQYGGRPAFAMRLVLAATLSASYGIYGPPFELCVAQAVRAGSEEYLDSEKYQLHHWDLAQPHSLAPLATRLNRIRREHPALWSDSSLCFHPTDNDRLLCYSKTTPDGGDVILVVVNLDPHHRQGGHVELSLQGLGLTELDTFQVHDMLGSARFVWQGTRNFVELDPHESPAHVFTVLRKRRTEHDFEYFL